MTSFLDGRWQSFRHLFDSLCADRRVARQIVMSWLGTRTAAWSPATTIGTMMRPVVGWTG